MSDITEGERWLRLHERVRELEGEAGVYFEIEAERIAQDVKWGGPVHDDEHDLIDWIGFIVDHARRAGSPTATDPRRQLVRVAALAVAAIESMDRKAKA